MNGTGRAAPPGRSVPQRRVSRPRPRAGPASAERRTGMATFVSPTAPRSATTSSTAYWRDSGRRPACAQVAGDVAEGPAVTGAASVGRRRRLVRTTRSGRPRARAPSSALRRPAGGVDAGYGSGEEVGRPPFRRPRSTSRSPSDGGPADDQPPRCRVRHRIGVLALGPAGRHRPSSRSGCLRAKRPIERQCHSVRRVQNVWSVSASQRWRTTACGTYQRSQPAFAAR